jgi:hypothetical protein
MDLKTSLSLMLIWAAPLLNVGLSQSAPQAPPAKKTQSVPAKKASPSRRPPSTPESRPQSVGQSSTGELEPQIVKLSVTKCIGCSSTLRRRVAVMPVKVGTLGTELGMPPAAVAEKARDRLEQAVAALPNVIAVNRSDLDATTGEQSLSRSPGFNQEIAPATGRLLPASFLLFATVDAIDVRTVSRKQSQNAEVDLIRQAEDAEDAIRKAEERQSALQRTRGDIVARLEAGSREHRRGWERCNAIPPTEFAQFVCFNELQKLARFLEGLQINLLENQSEYDMWSRNISADRDKARDLRQKARYESQKEVTETRRTSASVTLVWRLLDTALGATVASGTAQGEGQSEDTVTVSQGAGRSTETSTRSRYDSLINQVLSQAVAQLSRVLQDRIEKQPFRAKIAKVEPGGVVLNCGSNLGVSVGDTFGVRQKREVLTDPDTGLPLEKPGPPVGLIRVSEVFEATAFGQIIQSAGPLKRGDELEWVGTYTPETPGDSSAAPPTPPDTLVPIAHRVPTSAGTYLGIGMQDSDPVHENEAFHIALQTRVVFCPLRQGMGDDTRVLGFGLTSVELCSEWAGWAVTA